MPLRITAETLKLILEQDSKTSLWFQSDQKEKEQNKMIPIQDNVL